jgi:radical SAM protein with 4Fe4S-binding SPASM domain
MEIAWLYAQTYDIPEESAIETVKTILTRFPFALLLLPTRDPAPIERYSPKTFLFPGSNSTFDSSRNEPFEVPAGINLNLTFACNFRCIYCYQVVTNVTREMLPLSKCLSLAEEASTWGVVYFGITGGEPTLFPGWLTLVEKVLSCGMTPVMTSNGAVIGSSPSIARRLSVAGMERMTISLDASYPELHDRMTQSTGAFPRVVRAIQYLVEAGIRVVVKLVLTPINYADLEDFIDFVAGLGVEEVGISFQEGGATGSPANFLHSLTSAQIEEAGALVAKKARLLEGRCAIHPPKPPSLAWTDGVMPCGSLLMGMSIFPNGDVGICDKLPNASEFLYGNVLRQGLEEIWNGEQLQRIRSRTVDPSQIDAQCSSCTRLHECRTGCFVDSFNAAANYFAKHPDCGGPFSDPGGATPEKGQWRENSCN